MKSRRIRLAAVALFVGGGLCAALMAEACLKVIAATPLWRVLPVIEPILGQPDPQTGYAFTPGVSGIWVRENRARVQITELGLRGPQGITQAKAPGTVRIALLGDSVTEALQVEYAASFGALLQARLNHGGSAGTEVINLAMSGNGPLRQLMRLEQRGYSFDPDIVLSVTSPFDFLSGELRDDRLNPAYVPDGSGGWMRGYAFRKRFSVRQADTLAGRVFLDAVQRFDLVRLLYLRSRDPLSKLMGIEASARAPASSPVVADTCFTADLRNLQRLWQNHEPAQDWQVTGKFFDELAASRAGRPVKLVYALRDLPMPPARCASQRAQRAAVIDTIEDALATRQIGFIDLEKQLVDIVGVDGSADLRVLRGFGLQIGQGHLNHEGHRRYAEVLQTAVAELIGR
ncbi:hypothetical protein [Ferrovibrio terrae]|uniref:SGNH/GDSL hydrolase family protein n=1 Tax=Ferrovibrio terrae TaxID=2594003 RepID=UPI003137F146